ELMSGVVLTETVFNWPGLGRLAVQSVFNLDVPVMAGTVLFSAVLVPACNLGVDPLFGVLDPPGPPCRPPSPGAARGSARPLASLDRRRAGRRAGGGRAGSPAAHTLPARRHRRDVVPRAGAAERRPSARHRHARARRVGTARVRSAHVARGWRA